MRYLPDVRLIALALIGGLAAPNGAEAGQYVCQIPLALLCEGCARNVEISLQPGGSCRVSFDPSRAGAATPAGKVDIQIQTPAPPPRATRVAFYRRSRVALARPLSGRCFAFNGHEYCE
jgi:hypothetical protein